MVLLHYLYEGEIREQQEMLFPWVFLREYGLNLSHVCHDVARVGDGTIIVKMGYSLALYDWEVLPLWKEFPIYSSIVGDVFDNGHVKEWSYELAGAYLHRPIVLSLWSLGLLMECPQDHFKFDALGGQGGGENDEVVDGDIYYCDIFF